MNKNQILIKRFFEENSIVDSNLESFSNLIEIELQKIIEENKDIVPTIIPPDVDEFKIRMDRIWIKKPEITEADGSKRELFPIEARLRKLTYAAPLHIEVSAHVNGVQRESFTTMIGGIPIMLKSKYCHLHELSRDDLIKHGEDPDDSGGYFIINGTEKVIVGIEDLAANKLLVSEAKTGTSPFVGKLFSEAGAFKIPHTIEKAKDGIFTLTFTRVKKVPIILVLKALGMIKDEEIIKSISSEKQYDEAIMNLYEFADVKSSEDAIDRLAKTIGVTQSKDMRLERMNEIIDRYLLPHIGTDTEDRMMKAKNLCKLLKKYMDVARGDLKLDDKDHYMNKRTKLSGDLLSDLLRMNMRVLINDMLYNFQRIVKRGKFPSIKVIVREKLLTSRIYSAMATGNWVGGRKGVAQRMDRLNSIATTSHLQRVVSPLSASQENFEARELHATHLGRLCPIETPEGTNIGLRKNLAILCRVSGETDSQEVLKFIEDFKSKGSSEEQSEVPEDEL